ncbi:hypothetical protein NPIL_646031 [Nephila pilipes]|uniref:Uncharacterized protein n=1 Tax=Nephila pilipes TaxID=299642 RepID=A0A8X6NW27_NEPPI|nr:hypothetical protein NPIL_646031 [Nephila pilipes]
MLVWRIAAAVYGYFREKQAKVRKAHAGDKTVRKRRFAAAAAYKAVRRGRRMKGVRLPAFLQRSVAGKASKCSARTAAHSCVSAGFVQITASGSRLAAA